MDKTKRFFELCFSILFSFVLITLLRLDHRHFYRYQNGATLSDLRILFIVLILFLAALLVRFLFQKKGWTHTKDVSVKQTRILLIALSVVLFVLQLICTWNYFFKTGWDCNYIVTAASRYAFDGQSVEDIHYFSMYPNNLFLVWVFAGILKFANLFCEASYFPLVIVGVLFVNLGGFFMADLSLHLTKNRVMTYVSFALYSLLVGFCPWTSVPYSDAYAILFPILILWLYFVGKGKQSPIRWFFMLLLAGIGYLIKPTVILVLFCILLWEALSFLFQLKKRVKAFDLKKCFTIFACAVLGFTLSLGFKKMAMQAIDANLNDYERFTALHYFAMGMNFENGGGYNNEDVNRTASYESVELRNSENLSIALNRIRDMGPSGLATFMQRKILSLYNDGSFAWGMEGQFYWGYQDRPSKLATFIRSFYYEGDTRYQFFLNVSQFLMIGLLLTFPFFFLRGREEENDTCVLLLSIMAITAFLLIFEVRARYLFLYMPVFFTVFSLGVTRLFDRVKGKENE